MGASFFTTSARGTTAREAFHAAVKEAQYESGHGGYTGTIAEKQSFVLIPLPEGVRPYYYADALCEDERVESKWGPAGCFHIKDDQYYFFGWASS